MVRRALPPLRPQSGLQAPNRCCVTWYELVLELVRHTPTYSPPVASRSFAYLGVTAFEAVASGSGELQSLAGQLNGLRRRRSATAGETYDEAVVVQAAMAVAVAELLHQHRADRPAGASPRWTRN